MKKLKYFFFNLVLLFTATSFSGCTLRDFWGGKASESLKLEDIVVVLQYASTWLLGGAGGVAALFIIMGGYMYMTSHGSPEQTKTAKGTIVWAIVGLLLVVFAYAIVRLIMRSLLKGDSFNQFVG